MARQKNKTDTIGVRVSPKTRYALDLIARKHGASLSALMVSAAEKLIEAEGMTVVRPGDDACLLDKLWSESESERLLALKRYAPSLLTHPESVMAEILHDIQFIRIMEKDGGLPKGASALNPSQLLAVMLSGKHAESIFSPGINDTFADDLLKVGGEFDGTTSLKKAIKEAGDAFAQIIKPDSTA